MTDEKICAFCKYKWKSRIFTFYEEGDVEMLICSHNLKSEIMEGKETCPDWEGIQNIRTVDCCANCIYFIDEYESKCGKYNLKNVNKENICDGWKGKVWVDSNGTSE